MFVEPKMLAAFSWLLAIALIVQFFINRTKRKAFATKLLQCETNLKEAKQQLTDQMDEAVSQHEMLFDPMIEGVLILDSEGRVRLANKALRDLFRLSNEARGKGLLETIRSHELKEIAQAAFDAGHVTGREWVSRSGIQSRYFSVNASRFDGAKDSGGVILVFHDLTESKQIENGRREFIANVSHELRTPLSMIKGYVETLLQNVGDPAIEARFLGKIKKHSDRLTYLIEDLLTLSQLEDGSIALAFAKVPLASLVERVFDDLQDRAAQRAIRLQSQIPKSLWVKVDPDRMQQVFQNLVDNGIKYGRREGLVNVSAKTGEGFVEIAVADDGLGIPASARDRVFERFFRVEKARSREQGGTGLGLAIVKHIVQSHGGQVWLAPKKEATETGAIFNFTIPTTSHFQNVVN